VTEFWIVSLAVIVLTQSAANATSVYLHRALAHRSLAVHPAADLLLRTVLWLGTVLLCLVLGLRPGLVAAPAHAIVYVFVLAPLINGLGHWRGAQDFDNTAYNSRVLAWETGGESLHNNHHAHPAIAGVQRAIERVRSVVGGHPGTGRRARPDHRHARHTRTGGAGVAARP
jgi:fatty-acid desaturase